MKKQKLDLRLVAAMAIILLVLFGVLGTIDKSIIVEFPLPVITQDSIAAARSALAEDIESGSKNLGITLPPISIISPGSSFSGVDLLLKNTEPNPRCYILELSLTGMASWASSAYMNHGGCTGPACPQFSEISQELGWFRLGENALVAGPGETVSVPASLDIPDSAKIGGYAFTVYAYPADPLLLPGECSPGIDSSYADPRVPARTGIFQLEVRDGV